LLIELTRGKRTIGAMSASMFGLAGLGLGYALLVMHPALMQPRSTSIPTRLAATAPIMLMFVAAPYAIPMEYVRSRYSVCLRLLRLQVCMLRWLPENMIRHREALPGFSTECSSSPRFATLYVISCTRSILWPSAGTFGPLPHFALRGRATGICACIQLLGAARCLNVSTSVLVFSCCTHTLPSMNTK
jgi:hypothetical protein